MLLMPEDVKLVTPTEILFKQEKDWPLSRKLTLEKQVVGFYVSGHPMDPWQKICEDWLGWNTQKLKEFSGTEAAKPSAASGEGGNWSRPQRKEITMAGLISSMREIMTKKGTRMAFAQLEDLYGQVELVVFPNAYADFQELIKRAVAETEAVLVVADLDDGG